MPKKDYQFKKGNKFGKGRPRKAETYSDTLKELLVAQKIDVIWTINGKEKKLEVTSTQNMYYGIAASQIMEALRGNVKAAKEIVDRVQGKSLQPIATQTEDKDYNITISYND